MSEILFTWVNNWPVMVIFILIWWIVFSFVIIIASSIFKYCLVDICLSGGPYTKMYKNLCYIYILKIQQSWLQYISNVINSTKIPIVLLSTTVLNCPGLSSNDINCPWLSSTSLNCLWLSSTFLNFPWLPSTFYNCHWLLSTFHKCPQLSTIFLNVLDRQLLSSTVLDSPLFFINCQRLSSTFLHFHWLSYTFLNCP